MLARCYPVTTIDTFLLTVDWGEVMLRLSAFVARRYQEASEEQVEDVVQEAIQHLLDPDYRSWVEPNPSTESLMRHLGSEVNGIVINQRRKNERRRTGQVVPVEEALTLACDSPTAQMQLEAKAFIYELLDSLDGKDNACEVLYLIADGNIKAAAQIKALGWTTNRVYEARRKIQAAARKIRDA